MKRLVFLVGGVPVMVAVLLLSGCGDGVEPRQGSGAPTNTVAKPTATRTQQPPTLPPTRTPTRTPTDVPTEPSGPTATPTATPTGQIEPTDTPTVPAGAICGNNIVEEGEACDDGGTCLNGLDAGKRCPASVEGGVDCDSGLCRPSGGDGCAENCTVEAIVNLKLGEDQDVSQTQAIVQGAALRVDLKLTGRLTVRAGRARPETVTTAAGKVFNPGDIPAVETLEENRNSPETMEQGLKPIPIPPAIACACVRGFAVKSCGAVLGGPDCSAKCEGPGGERECAGGSKSLEPCTTDDDCPSGVCGQFCNLDRGNAQCKEGSSCVSNDDVCTPDAACDFIHGPGNYASGIFGCGEGTTGVTGEGINYISTRDSLTGKDTRVFSGGLAPKGSFVLVNSVGIGTIVSSNCEFDPSFADNGPDGMPCTDDDPDKAFVNTIPLTTGTAEGRVVNANGAEGVTIADGSQCGGNPCIAKFTGSLFDCDDLAKDPPVATSGSLAGAYGSEDLDPLGDVAVPQNYIILP